MSKYLFDGLPPKVVTYIKLNLRHMYSTGLFSYQEREDLIQDLVLFYLEHLRRRCNVTDDYLFIAIRTRAKEMIRTRLRHMHSGLFSNVSLNSMCEEDDFEPASSFCLSDLEDAISVSEIMALLSEKEQKFVRFILNGHTSREAKRLAHVSNNVMQSIQKKVKNKKNEKI